MEIGQEALNKWEKEQTKKLSKTRRRRYGFTIAKKCLQIDLYGLNPTEKVVYINLRLYTSPTGICYPSMRHQASDLHLDKNTIRKTIEKLKEKGFLKIKSTRGKGGKRFEYQLLK